MTGELPRTQLRNVLGKWRDNLIDLSGRNRLLNFRHTRTATLAIRSPAAGPLIVELDAGLTFAALPEDDSGHEGLIALEEADGIVTQKSTQSSLDASLRKLRRDSNQVFNDTGLWTLQLGAAFLKWREPGAEGFSSAPLLLIPVRLDQSGPGAYKLITEQGEDPVPNPALAVKMDRLGLDWPAPDDMKDLYSTLKAVRAAIASHPDWEVTEDVVLATFRSYKEAMYRDLIDHEDRILAHPLVQAIGLGSSADLPDDALYFDPVDVDRIDEFQPPEETPLVLDADSSQRQCVAAALDGRSFVMDGPPGTGKSQTIANMIAALMHKGRSVLFVSEKAAALDVVSNRLDAVGLGAFLLSLHSHHATRKEVAKTLGAALSQRPRASHADLEADRQRLLNTREDLSAYAAAMNEIRPPLGLPLHYAIGRVSALAKVPLLPTGLPEGLTAAGLQEIFSAAEALRDSWRPIAEGTDFAWRDLTGRGSPQTALLLMRERGDALHRRLAAHSELIEPLGLTSLGAAERVLALLDTTANRPVIPAGWLATPHLPILRAYISEFSTRLGQLRASAAAVVTEAGPDWDRLPEGMSAASPAEERALADLVVEGLDLASLTRERLLRAAADFQATAGLLRDADAALGDIAAVYGMPAPMTLEQVHALCALTDFARAKHRPETFWLADDGRAAALAATELSARFSSLTSARAVAGQVFSEKILEVADFPALVQRYTETHGLGRLTSSHRGDKRLLADLTVSGEWTKEAAGRLPQALAWFQASEALRQAATTHAATLGRYWQGEQTDFGLISRLLQATAQITRLAQGLRSPAALAEQVTSRATPDMSICATADRIRERLDAWRRTLVPAPQPGGRPRLAQGTLADAAIWYSAHLRPLNAAAELIALVQPVQPSATPLDLSRARRIISQVEAVRAKREAFLDRRAHDEHQLGSLYGALDTDTTSLTDALEWVARVRPEHEAMPEKAAQVLLSAQPDEELRALWGSFRAAAADFVQLFDGRRRSDLQAQIMGTIASFEQLSDRLAADRSGPDEWHSFGGAQATLRRYGLDGLIDRASVQGLDGARFRDVVERAVLEAWVDKVMRSDSRLNPVRAVERDNKVESFRRLDKALVANAHARVIDACNARRPRPNIGQAATIQREAEKKGRHMPVRTLLEKTSEVVPLVKPCFMMSPLTVSQFLPPGYRFDVVIFDEASQVLPQDAVNCIYRGDSLIVAGDQKQLPPTDFFAQADEVEDDEYDEDAPDSFESLLDMCKASGLIRSLSLSWHYRSRHEDLIAFSNREFYGSSLVTFPGAHESGDDVGVTFTQVPGVYQRGRSRRNPLEARAVAERVLHHYATRPHLSLGVVAMSDAQAHAIEDAVDAARIERPDLDRFFSEDRLNGFFIKNLETVQGDERDVIILSVGYGPDQDGRLTMAFGPLNRENGWRRLNVAVTRARHRVEVIASISGGNIRESDNKSRNHFKKYLDYAERGPAILEHSPVADDAAPESPFEESVLGVLLDWGYDVQPQVGVGGYRIDMAVRHPRAPGRFAIGIECDGAMYHSSKAARDRDRLREEMLNGLGWTLHRIWGTDWYRDRPAAEDRLREAIEAAIAVQPEEPAVNPEIVLAPTSLEAPVTMVPDDIEPARAWASTYRRAPLDVSYHHDMHMPESRDLLQRLFRMILEIEAPIQRDVLYRRAATVWYVERIGSRIRANLDRALDNFARSNPDVTREGETLTLQGRQVVAREPGDDVLRKVGEIPSEERKTALLGIVGESPGMAQTELITQTARFFGWNRRGSDIDRALSQDLLSLQDETRIKGLPDRIVLA